MIDVPTMHQVANFRFAATDGVKVLEMPYMGGEVVMTFVLPDAPAGLEAVEQRLSPATLDGWLGAMQLVKVIVALPKELLDAVLRLLGDPGIDVRAASLGRAREIEALERSPERGRRLLEVGLLPR